MVKLTLTPHRGNGARTFPATGHLGLSPVTLAGVVRVKVEEDRKTIEASEVLVRVRCYESVGGSSSSSTGTSSSASSGGNSSLPGSSGSNGADTSISSYASTSVADLIKGGSGVPKGNVLYEQGITMWLPPSPQLRPVAPTTSASTSSIRASTTASTSSYYSTSEFDSTASSSSRSSTASSPSPSPILSSPPCSRSSSADPHAYPPRPRRRDDDTMSSSSQPVVTYGTLGDLQKAFRIVIPPDAVSKGAKSTMIYKTWRIWWAIEAVIAHRPSGIHGDRIVKSHQVALISYASHRISGPLEWISPSLASTSSDKSRSAGDPTASPMQPPQQQPSIAYSITAPAAAFAASDPIAVNVTLTKRYPTAEAPRKIVLELMREITYAQPESVSSGALIHAESSFAATSATSAVSPSSSATTITSGRLSSYFSSNRHSRANSNAASHAVPTSLSLNLASSHTFGTSRRRSEAQEPLISPPLLTSASTASSSSVALPGTPPTFVPTPGEQSHTTGDSYFGLFSGSSTASLEPVETLSAAGLASAPFSTMSSKKSTPGSSSLAPAATLTTAAAGSAARRRREYVTLATFETDCTFSASSGGTTWSGQITGTMPKAKSIYHYALGETCTTQSASSRFFLVPKIYYKSKTHVLELPPRLVAFQTMSTEERRKAKDMLPKTLAVQKAEAKLFGGLETVAPAASSSESRSKSASKSTASSRHPSPSANPSSRPGLSPAPSTSSMSASARSAPGNIPSQSGTNKSRTSNTRESSHRSPDGSRSARVVPSSPSAGNSSEEEMLDLQHFGYPVSPEGTSMRRRSEQAAASESLRMRQRFGAAPDLSPVIGSPYIEAVSPSLSVISSSTQRPRSANKRPATGNSSLRSGTTAFSSSSTARPASSGGLEPSNASIRSVSSGRFGHITTFADLSNSSLLDPVPRKDTRTAPPVLVRLDSGKRDDARDSSLSEDDDVHHPLQPSVVNGLFADFSGFTLKPQEGIDGKVKPLTKNEDRIPPKSNTPLKPSYSSSSSKRQNTEGHSTFIGQSPGKTQPAAGQVSGSRLVHMQASPPPLNRLPSETAPSGSATMAKSVSQAVSLPSPQPSPEIPRARRVKSGGVASAFAFFRRGSAKT